MTTPTLLRLDRAARISFAFLFAWFVLLAALRLGTPFLTVLFSYFALSRLNFGKRQGLSVVLFVALVLAVIYGFSYFINQAIIAVPKIAATAIPVVIQFAEEHNIELPFTDFASLKSLALEQIPEQMNTLGASARRLTTQMAFMLIGVVVAIGLFLNARLDLDRERHPVRNNLYSLVCEELAARFRTLYESFATVIGAQITISAINTTLTSIFVIACRLPYAGLIIAATFLCGLLPIIGNLISNTVIVCVALTVSLKLGLIALIFLIVLHKLEYFLNSKIIGDRIKNPMWLTLLALVIGERLMGIAGMILAPVILNYVRMETTRIEVVDPSATALDG